MSILVDLKKVSDLNSGLGQVANHLGNELLKLDHENELQFLVEHAEKYFFKNTNSLSIGKWQRRLGLNYPKAQVWHGIHQDIDILPRDPSTKLVLTIQDLNFLKEIEDQNKVKRLLKGLQDKINRAQAVVCTSEYVACDVRAHLDIDEQLLHKIPLGAALDRTTQPLKVAGLDQPFLFNIGVISAKKNVHALVPMLSHLKDYDLILAGHDGTAYANDIKKKVEQMGLQKRVRFLGKISEGEKVWLFQNCAAFVFPSLLEGFGLPVLEAMSQGRPVISSDRCSLPEIGGDLNGLWKNFDPEYMASTLSAHLDDFNSEMDAPLMRKKWAARFQWSTCASEYWKLYHQLI